MAPTRCTFTTLTLIRLCTVVIPLGSELRDLLSASETLTGEWRSYRRNLLTKHAGINSKTAGVHGVHSRPKSV
ncbi:hypothetical protein PISMIDRAFT_357653 [Pisolithus microcarpus 441]|uniref:Secreted protein n=1 Tax=Pisolithus microcarpus 441 TaxID=765257 RepID=A0A0C9YKB3_9AGAM|nr:hypothetical protein BKA83DRAFT_357653 [Pisolithus microcarpus]KIK14299.1 hypothetical protein PISMIDRAFT_357653 [Pisolithus microcarpus 441]